MQNCRHKHLNECDKKTHTGKKTAAVFFVRPNIKFSRVDAFEWKQSHVGRAAASQFNRNYSMYIIMFVKVRKKTIMHSLLFYYNTITALGGSMALLCIILRTVPEGTRRNWNWAAASLEVASKGLPPPTGTRVHIDTGTRLSSILMQSLQLFYFSLCVEI